VTGLDRPGRRGNGARCYMVLQVACSAVSGICQSMLYRTRETQSPRYLKTNLEMDLKRSNYGGRFPCSSGVLTSASMRTREVGQGRSCSPHGGAREKREVAPHAPPHAPLMGKQERREKSCLMLPSWGSKREERSRASCSPHGVA
jgi:hypothetical protein